MGQVSSTLRRGTGRESAVKNKCNCHSCVRGRRIDSVKASGERSDLISLVDELHDDLENTEDDLEYKNAILDGSWPNAAEILTRALARVSQKTAVKGGDVK